MTYSTADYSEVDPTLDRWAARRSVEWIRDDQGWDVRTLYWQLQHPESVQLWVAEPLDGKVTVHVCHNTTEGGQQNTQTRAAIDDLEPVLDESFNIAQSLADKLKRNIRAQNN